MKFNYCCYSPSDILTQADLDKLDEELKDFVPVGSLSPMLLSFIFHKAYDLNLIVPKYEYDNQVKFNKQLKTKLRNIDK